ncbi:type II toxin-antitoxin system mRNA interferase toxin, RelE/StbE family [Candidatus Shapirobacteria bacterium]|nr:type II toxin-antitoxin system mRNA interferase toxin, RelE/StbE family [Candidatus Shapirobacteria bacterium]
MEIVYHKQFLKHYRLRIFPHKKLDIQFAERLKLFVQDSTHPLLKDHRLVGKKKEYRAFAITGDIRVVYKKENDTLFLYDVGTHPQVYAPSPLRFGGLRRHETSGKRDTPPETK